MKHTITLAALLLLGTQVAAEPLSPDPLLENEFRKGFIPPAQQEPPKAQLTPTQQRLEQLERAERDAKAAEEKKWRTFPKPYDNTVSAFQVNLFPELAPESCSYNWAEWKLDPATGIRSTQMRCRRSNHHAVAVNCSTLKLSSSIYLLTQQMPRGWKRWTHWRLPSDEGQRQMVVALCDQIAGARR